VFEARPPMTYLHLISSEITVAGWTPINQPYGGEHDSLDGSSRTTVKGAESSKKSNAKAKKPVNSVSEGLTRKRASRANPTRQSFTKRQRTTSVDKGPQTSSTAVSSPLSEGSRAYSAPIKHSFVSTTTLNKLEAFRFQTGNPSGNIAAPSLQQNNLNGAIASPLAQTSMDVVNANSGYGYTIYQGASSRFLMCEVKSPPPFKHLARIAIDEGFTLKPVPEEGFRLPAYQNGSAPYKNARCVTSLSSLPTVPNDDCLGSSIAASDPSKDIGEFDDFATIDDEDILSLEIPLNSNESDCLKLFVQNSAAGHHKNTLNHPAENFHPSVESYPVLNPFDDMEDEWASLDDAEVLKLIDLTMEDACGGQGEYASNQDMTRQGNSESKNTTVSTPANSMETPKKSVKSRPPIVRPPFPSPVRDRSPILGVSTTMNLRTCFRVGEALNSGVLALSTNKDMIIELYAKVVSSHREAGGVKHYFVFSDLFHDRPPFLNGVYDLWKGSTLWEYDSGRFLDPQDPTKQKLCRCLGRVKKDEKHWKFMVLNIWEASWDDVDHVKGIVCAS
jgi:hypothetical protein